MVTVVKDDLHGFMRTRQSLEQQSFDMWEHIVVSASAGDSVSLYVEDIKHERTELRVQRGRGIYSAMNQGFTSATQEFVVFLNAGDTLACQETLDMVRNTLMSQDSQWFIFGGYMKAREKVTEVRPVPDPDSWSVGCGNANIMHPSVYYRRSFLVQLGGYDESFHIAADLDLHIRASAIARPWVEKFLTSIFYADGVSSNRVFTSIYEAYKARSKVLVTGFWPLFSSLSWFSYQVIRALGAKLIRQPPTLFVASQELYGSSSPRFNSSTGLAANDGGVLQSPVTQWRQGMEHSKCELGPELYE